MGQFRPYLLATVSSSVLLTGAAIAPAMAQPYTWTGFYIGLNAGGASNGADFTQHNLGGGFFFGLERDYWDSNKVGATAGALTGYNWQSGNFVFGVEGDLNLLSGRDSASFSNVGTSTKMDWYGTARARFGFATGSPLLIYLSAGVAVAQISNTAGFTVGSSPDFHSSGIRTAPVFGAGIEYKSAPNMTVRLEGLFADFGNKDSFVEFGGTYKSTFRNTLAVVRGAVTWAW